MLFCKINIITAIPSRVHHNTLTMNAAMALFDANTLAMHVVEPSLDVDMMCGWGDCGAKYSDPYPHPTSLPTPASQATQAATSNTLTGNTLTGNTSTGNSKTRIAKDSKTPTRKAPTRKAPTRKAASQKKRKPEKPNEDARQNALRILLDRDHLRNMDPSVFSAMRARERVHLTNLDLEKIATARRRARGCYHAEVARKNRKAKAQQDAELIAQLRRKLEVANAALKNRG